MENINSTMISTSLPQIAKDLETGAIHVKLALTSYLLSLAAFTPASGWVPDRFGARRDRRVRPTTEPGFGQFCIRHGIIARDERRLAGQQDKHHGLKSLADCISGGQVGPSAVTAGALRVWRSAIGLVSA